jgi:hypothetical protein
MAAYDLVGIDDRVQLDLFSSSARQRRLEVAIDELAERFGLNIVHRASDLTKPPGMRLAPTLTSWTTAHAVSGFPPLQPRARTHRPGAFLYTIQPSSLAFAFAAVQARLRNFGKETLRVSSRPFRARKELATSRFSSVFS